MVYCAHLATTVQTYLDGLSDKDSRLIKRHLRRLEVDPWMEGVVDVRCEIEGLYFYRVGRWRIFYRVAKQKEAIQVVHIANSSNRYPGEI